MRSSFDARIARAKELAETYPTAASLLSFYRELAQFQKPIFEHAESDVRLLVRYFPPLLDMVRSKGPEPLARYAAEHLLDQAAQEQLLVDCWQGEAPPDAGRFYARVLLQPYAEHLASAAGNVSSNPLEASVATCPFCTARPALAVLRGEGDGAKRSLMCSMCATEWTYRRVICPGCGEENKDHLPIYIADAFDYIRVDACDTCRTYIKSVDLTKNGRAVPVVDEIATVALNIWAEEHDYAKLEPNLLGM
ncbi:MAG TPA: formate dehydrogenase accessory protein FdhE [Bryobacteraceae bacterium]|nr:formate dehydrogenase accessory protein FdhE [Bryobacteraceae bacterium]